MKEYGHEWADFYYYTPSDFERLGGIWPIRSGRNTAKANYAVGPRMIECYSIHVIVSGAIVYTYGEEQVRLNKGDLFCLFPGMKHSYRIIGYTTTAPLRMQWLAFDGPQATQLLERLGVSLELPYSRGCVTIEAIERMKQIMGLIQAEGSELLLQQSLYHLFGLLSERRTTLPSRDQAWLARCEAYLANHYMEPIAIADLSDIAGVHRSHLYAEFHRRYGRSPKHYLIQLRMEKARELLARSDLTVTEIALSLSYSDVYAFSRAFGRYYGMTPTACRNQHQEEARQ